MRNRKRGERKKCDCTNVEGEREREREVDPVHFSSMHTEVIFIYNAPFARLGLQVLFCYKVLFACPVLLRCCWIIITHHRKEKEKKCVG